MPIRNRFFKLILKIFVSIVLGASLILIASVNVVDRTSYQDLAFYEEMMARLDSLEQSLTAIEPYSELLLVGWSTVNITPDFPTPLAGYGARRPMTAESLLDSSFVRTLIFKDGQNKLAIVSADLLIIHPELSQSVIRKLPVGWTSSEVFFTATHTHSGQGGWALGLVGELFAGKYDPQTIEFLSEKFVLSLQQAVNDLDTASLAFGEMEVGDLVINRLVKEKGIIDPFLKTITINKKAERGILVSYSAHATCLGLENHQLSGDFPSEFLSNLKSKELFDFGLFAAGAVGSMGPAQDSQKQSLKKEAIATELSNQLELFQILDLNQRIQPAIRSFKINIPLRLPTFKVTENFALRPYLFSWAFGNYPHYISVAQLGKTIILGMPCDFSGELAVPLYAYAREKGLDLIITSFNGDYTGYVIKDEWYDLPKYEARTMSWYGPDAGSYFSEVSRKLIDILSITTLPN